ncbi:hypothetical protein SAMN02799631_00277 [Methylobacterium sp. 174MFSha1.1]|uniref:hypothetical protein n=1 Tax=Methylobacterium sp. 174MFSha1.1 TaxID=1502749 RepID=UPI0008E388FE|nr:hypothetical protein [Methylobacterium sp. 174MFSha1.1]SFU34806.1 hypothetical protein SAMN02799631_00277 [Methylobacterium sp. 174MFSha1.1]
MRSLTLALAAVLLVAAVPAEAARSAKSEPAPFPDEGDRFYVSVRGPARDGRAGFARIYASPVDRIWGTVITCGTVDVRTGRETIILQATGQAARSRWGDLGGTYNAVGGGPTGGWGIDEQHGLDVKVTMSAPCPTGSGQVSSGD